MTPCGKLEQLAGHAAFEAVDAGDAVAHGDHGAHLGDVHSRGESPELLADDLGDLFGANLHQKLQAGRRQADASDR